MAPLMYRIAMVLSMRFVAQRRGRDFGLPSSLWSRTSSLIFLAALVLCAAVPVVAGEKPGPLKSAGKQPLGESAPADILGKKYVLLTTGHRDPFTIWKEDIVKPTIGISEDDLRKELPAAAPVGKPAAPVPGVDVAKMVQDAYDMLYRGEYAECDRKCNDALNKMETDAAGGMSAHVSQLQERCLRIQKAAKKLKMRDDVQKEFAQLPIRIDGIVWRPKAGFAVINGKVQGVGDMLSGARIYQINPYDVVFVYKGLKVSKRLFEGGKTDAGKASKARK
jgi:hypothetical protein